MKNFSFLGCVINIILYVAYVFVAMLAVGLIYWAISSTNWSVPVDGDFVYDKLAVVTILVVLIITTVFRKVFYRKIWNEGKVVVTTQSPQPKKSVAPKTTTKKEKWKMKIYVDKQIK